MSRKNKQTKHEPGKEMMWAM